MALLVAAGADVNALNADGETPMHLAVGRGSVSGVDALLKAGADATIRDRRNMAPGNLLPDDRSTDLEEEAAIRRLLEGIIPGYP